MIHVVIPYVRKEAQGRELELAIEGWIRHFKEDFRIVVVGDFHPCLDNYPGKVNWIQQTHRPYASPEDYLPHIDIAYKLNTFILNWMLDKEFIYASDDVYAVRDFTLDDIRVPGWRLPNVPPVHPSTTGWAKDLSRTHEVLRRLDYPERHYVTHAPVVFEKQAFLGIKEAFKLTQKSYVFEDLYFNIHRPLAPRRDLSKVEALCKFIINYGLTAPKRGEIERDVKIWKPIFLNNGTAGWSQDLEDYLVEHYRKLMEK